jgi:neutral ceramidase
MARAFVMREANASAADAVAIVALDLLALSGSAVGGWSAFKAQIAEAAGRTVEADRIILVCSHTHCGPESAGLSNLFETPQHKAWIAVLTDRIGQAIRNAATAARPCRLEHGVTAAPGLSIYRRIRTTQGVLLSHPPPPDEIVLSRDGPIDDSVNVLVARDMNDGAIISMIVNATCHPVHEMCIPRVSADFPGILTDSLEHLHPGCVALFLNGAAGNINPTTVSAGPAASRKHGSALAEAVTRIITSGSMKLCDGGFALARRTVSLPSRLPRGRSEGQKLNTEVVGFHVGSMAFAFLPGEPFVETALSVRERSPFETTAVVGYAEDYIGYVPTDLSFVEGGYETTFGHWSVLDSGSEPILRNMSVVLLKDLYAGISAK